MFACAGQIIFLQNMGNLATYNAHDQTGFFAVAAILVGGASVTHASIPNVFIGVILLHAMFIVSPLAGQNLFGSAMIGEYFRQFIGYGVIALSLVLYAWKVEEGGQRRQVPDPDGRVARRQRAREARNETHDESEPQAADREVGPRRRLRRPPRPHACCWASGTPS